MPIWIIIGYLAGSNVPIASFLDYAYVSPDTCEDQRHAVAKTVGPNVKLECQQVVLKK